MPRMESPEENYQRVSARLSGSRLDRFEQYLDDNDVSKSVVIRRGIDLVTSNTVEIENGPPLTPPTEERLAWAYDRLYKASNVDGVISGEAALRVCSGGPEGYSKKEVKPILLKPLHRRNYIRRNANIYGDEAYKLVGWDR